MFGVVILVLMLSCNICCWVWEFGLLVSMVFFDFVVVFEFGLFAR